VGKYFRQYRGNYFTIRCEVSSQGDVNFLHIWCDLTSHLLDDPGDDAPDEEVVVRADGYGFVLGVLLVAG